MVHLKISKIIIIFLSFFLLLFLHPLKTSAQELSVTYNLSGNGMQMIYLPGPVNVGKVNILACSVQNRNGGFQVGIALLYEGIQVAYRDTLRFSRSGCPMWASGGTAEGTALDFGGTSADAIKIIPILGRGSYYQMYVTYEEGAGPRVIQCGADNPIAEYFNWSVPWGRRGDFVLPSPVKIHKVNAYGCCDQNRDGGCSDDIALLYNSTQVAYKGIAGGWIGEVLRFSRSSCPMWAFRLSPTASALNFGGVLADTIRAVPTPGWRAGARIYRIFYTHEPEQCTSAPIAVATISTDGLNYDTSTTVGQSASTSIFLSAAGSSHPNGWDSVSNGGYCEWNSDLNQGDPTFEQKIMNPPSPEACNISLGELTFNDITYEYQSRNIVTGWQTPRCSCDSSYTLECPAVFPASISNPSECYDQYLVIVGFSVSVKSKRYEKVQVGGNNIYKVLRVVDKDGIASPIASVSVTVQPSSPNQPPSASTLPATQPDYCTINWPAGIFSWSFTDLDPGDSQSAYQVQVDNNSGFTSPEVDSCKVISSISRSYATGICGSCCVNPPCSCSIADNNTYYWRLKVWDSNDASSTWIEYNDPTDPDGDGNPKTFTTPEHAYPVAENFTWIPFEPAAKETVTFSPPVQPASVVPTWAWTIPDANYVGGTNSASKNPQVQFNSEGEYAVSLTVTDAPPHSSYFCPASVTINLQLPLPEWKEIPPF